MRQRPFLIRSRSVQEINVVFGVSIHDLAFRESGDALAKNLRILLHHRILGFQQVPVFWCKVLERPIVVTETERLQLAEFSIQFLFLNYDSLFMGLHHINSRDKSTILTKSGFFSSRLSNASI